MKTFMMLDVEALARNANGVILSIGACIYDVDGIKSDIELYPSISEQVALGREIEDETFAWWLKQPDEARRNIANGERSPIRLVADEFVEWASQERLFAGATKETLWFSAFGNDFDYPMVDTLLGKLRTMPWEGRPNYQNKMCLRAVSSIFEKDIVWPEGKTAHTARADARNQALAHISVLKKHLYLNE
jgi:hypothetical protein